MPSERRASAAWKADLSSFNRWPISDQAMTVGGIGTYLEDQVFGIRY